MTHIEVENLASEYLEGLLSTGQKADVETHLASCAPCQELVAGVREVMELSRAAEDLESAPWLISKIMRATVGERKPTTRERLAAFLRVPSQPRLVYAAAMTVFSLSIIVNAARLNLRHLTAQDLNPRTWVRWASHTGRNFYARAELFCYNLRVVYEIESRFKGLSSEQQKNEQETAKPEENAPGGSTDHQPLGDPQFASIPSLAPADLNRVAVRPLSAQLPLDLGRAGRRSSTP